jgi:hypothetical protein
MGKTNKDKTTEIDESILEETPPNINEPQDKEEEEEIPEEETEVEEEEVEEEVVEEKKEVKPPVEEDKETPEEKEKRYKAQQSEAQIQIARNKNLVEKVDKAASLPEPTVDELKAFVAQDGINWEDLTTFEQITAKRTYLAERRFALVNEAVQETKKVDEWVGKVDTFIDSTFGKPEFVKLSGHEAEFRKFALKESHRGAEITSLLLPAFLNQLPIAPKKKQAAIFETGGGGEKAETTSKIIDTEKAADLRATNPREWRRQVKAGNIKVEA